MRAKTVRSTLQYGDRTPARWLRTAAASIDASLAGLCLRRWSYARIAFRGEPQLERRG